MLIERAMPSCADVRGVGIESFDRIGAVDNAPFGSRDCHGTLQAHSSHCSPGGRSAKDRVRAQGAAKTWQNKCTSGARKLSVASVSSWPRLCGNAFGAPAYRAYPSRGSPPASRAVQQA